MLGADTERGKQEKKTSRGPAHAWERWNDLDVPDRLRVMQAFSEAYETFQIAAFGGPKQADASLWKVLANFQGARGWTGAGLEEVFASLRLHLTPILEQTPYLSVISENLSTPAIVSAAEAWRWLFKGDNKAYNRLSVAAFAGFDEFHAWLIKKKPELRKSVRCVLPISLGGVLKSKHYAWLTWKAGLWLKGLIALLFLILSIFSDRYLFSCEGCTREGVRRNVVLDEPSDKDEIPLVQRQVPEQENVEAGVVDAGLASAIPQKCSHLPPGPDRKECLIKLADSSRADFERAEYLYKLAIAYRYDAHNTGERPIERYWHWSPSWPPVASGHGLLDAQTYNAMVALASLYARHNDFAQASRTWAAAVSLAESGDPAFHNGPGDCAYYIQAFFNRRAALRPPTRETYPSWAGCHGQVMLERAVAYESDGDELNCIRTLADVFENLRLVSQGVADPLVHPEKDPYWSGILPDETALYAHARQIRERVLQLLKGRRQAIESANTVILLDLAGTISGAIIPASDPFCVQWAAPANQGPPVWGSVLVDLDGKTFNALSPNAGQSIIDVPIGKFTQDVLPIVARIFGRTRDGGVWHECEENRAEAILCRKAGGMWLLSSGQRCQ